MSDPAPGDGRNGAVINVSAALLTENRRLGTLVAAADPTTPVPTCPGWSLTQLMRHVGRGDRWAAAMVAQRATEGMDPRAVPDGKPPDDPDGAAAWFAASPQLLLDAVAVDPDTEVWTFIGPRPARWWIRRRLHESTVHRADAALAVGVAWDIEPELAADGISEWLDQLGADRGRTGQRPLADGAVLHLHATDPGLGTAGEWLVRGSATGISWEHGHGRGDVALRGGTADLLLALLRRHPPDHPALTVHGDAAVWHTWLDATPF